jgi:hypothetical protein
MFLWFPVLDLARAPRRTARKKGSGYENGFKHSTANLRICANPNNLYHVRNLQSLGFLILKKTESLNWESKNLRIFKPGIE